jgi:hypothetical protein
MTPIPFAAHDNASAATGDHDDAHRGVTFQVLVESEGCVTRSSGRPQFCGELDQVVQCRQSTFLGSP